ncbi:ankyrin repeat [Trichoderma arundinaceum]|uniref:Ankyrin repeat n=1 Tax=Trichoderma arundinaceum TaxID=490622 RepID=A0A395NWS4_TRIAR|nr:ankyrin repeat [Trichoderma arundinaceum]
MTRFSNSKAWFKRKLKQDNKLPSSPAATVLVSDPISSRTPVDPSSEIAEISPTASNIVQSHAPTTSPQAVDVGDTLSRSENDLWASAYSLIQEREGDLMRDYEKHLASLQNYPVATEGYLDARDVESLVNKLLEARERSKIQVSILRRNIKVREQVEKLAKFLIWSDSVVKAAVSAQPYAALAWSGVSLFLPLLVSGSKYNESMLEGFNTISDMQIFWKSCEETYFKPQYIQLYQNLKIPLVKLYSFVIEYQARVICHLSKAQISRAWQSMTGPDDWDNAIKSIKELEDKCSRLIDKVHKDVIYEKLENQLQEIEKSRIVHEDILRTMKEDRQDEKERQLLNDLAKGAGDYERYKDINPERVPGTCEWFLADERFCKWRDSHSGDILWVSAGPGCGKSVLSKTFIDEGHLNLEATITITSSTITVSERVICYFFFKEGGEGRMDTAHALCAILHQLFRFKSTSNLITHALSSHRDNGQTLTEKMNELWRIFVECANFSPVQIVCVLDALDECKKERRKELIGMLQRLYSQGSVSLIPSKLKFLITSRPYEDLEGSFNKFSPAAAYLHFDGDGKSGQIGKEINLVIDVKVKHIAGSFSDEDRDKISQSLKRMENRTYLWLHLTLDIIEENMSAYSRSTDIEDFLSELPLEVSDAYEKILSRSQDAKKVEALLQIVLAATRPLTVDEANYALVLALGKEQFSSHEGLQRKLWPQDRFEMTLRNLCGLFISIHDSKLSFIHQTAREFLVHSERAGTWKGRLNMHKAHGVLSGACINYLLLIDRPSTTGMEMVQKYQFFYYATKNWPLHFHSQDAESTAKNRKHARELCRTSAPQTQLWATGFSEYIFRDKWWIGWPDLTLASYFGLAAVVKDIIVHEHADVNTNGAIDVTALHMAIIAGQLEAIEILLEPVHGTHVTERSVKSAVENEQKAAEIMTMLLDKRGDEIEITEDVLRSAVTNKEAGVATIALLLEKRPNDVNITAEVVKEAAQRGSSDTMSLLLDTCGHGIIITEYIIIAAMANDRSMLELLLERRVHEIKFTEAVIINALIRHAETLGLILDSARSIKITEHMVVTAARGSLGNMEELLNKRGAEIKITEAIVKAATDNNAHGSEMLSLLIHRRGNEIKITEDIVKAAARNYTGGLELVAVLLDKRGDEVNLTQGIIDVVQSRDFWKEEILALFRQKC